jgi:transcriptional regulator with XRE-family HTH domain
MGTRDELDDLIEKNEIENSLFRRWHDAARRRLRLLRSLPRLREGQGLSQAHVAKLMQTSRTTVERLESGELDTRLSTLEQYAAAIGKTIEWRLVDRPGAGANESEIGVCPDDAAFIQPQLERVKEAE